MSSTYRAMVLGSTGAVGRHVVQELVHSPKCRAIVAVVRRPGSPSELFGIESDKIEVTPVDFDTLNPERFQHIDIAFSCLGTTRRQAGSAEAFKKVDLDYVVNTARLLAEGGTTQMLMVTATNANPESWLLYPQTKGLAERQVAALAFRRLVVLRPGLLIRDQTDRFGEKVASWILPSSMQVHVADVAKALVKLADDFDSAAAATPETPKVEYVDHATIKSLASSSAQ